MIIVRYFSFLLLTLSLITSCDKPYEESKKNLKINFQEGDLPSLHPHQLMIYLRGISIGKSLYEGLTRLNSLGEVELAGARSVDRSQDGLEYTFQLKKNFWSDGSEVLAQDYERAMKMALLPSSNSPRSDLLFLIKGAAKAKAGEIGIESVGITAVDGNSLKIELENPSPYLLQLLAEPIAAPLKDEKEEVSLFNGPFMVKKWQKGDLLILQKNPHFWNEKEVQIDEIAITMVQDTSTLYSMYEQSQIDWIGVPFAPLPKEFIEDLEQQGKITKHAVDRSFVVFLNTDKSPLTSKYLRKAMNHSFDRSDVVKHIFGGGIAQVKPIANSLLPSQNLNKYSAEKSYDLQLAKEYLNKALAELEVEQLPEITIAYSQQAGRKQLAEYLQQSWQQNLNLDITLKPEEWNIFRVNLSSGDYQVKWK